MYVSMMALFPMIGGPFLVDLGLRFRFQYHRESAGTYRF